MAWGYWSATSVDRGRSPRRHTHCNVMPINTVPQSEPPAPTCYSPCRSSRCSSPSCHASQVKLCHLFRSYTLISVLWPANRLSSPPLLSLPRLYNANLNSAYALPICLMMMISRIIAESPGGRNGKQNGSARDVYQRKRPPGSIMLLDGRLCLCMCADPRQGIIRLT